MGQGSITVVHPCPAVLPVLIDGDGGDAGSHAGGLQQTVKMGDLVGVGRARPRFVDGGDGLAGQDGGLQGDFQRAVISEVNAGAIAHSPLPQAPLGGNGRPTSPYSRRIG